jgi:hypothetical protein
MFMQDATSFRAAEKIALSLDGLTLGGLNLGPDVRAAGILAGSLVETESGWRPVERLARGIRVATWDGGFRPLAAVERRHLWPAAGVEVIQVPGGALDTCSGFDLMPGQHVFLASAVAEAVLGVAGALVPASALAGHAGITRRPLLRRAEVITLRFAGEEVVYVNSGALVHCAAEVPGVRQDAGGAGFFEVLDEDRARAMLALVAAGALTTAEIDRAA